MFCKRMFTCYRSHLLAFVLVLARPNTSSVQASMKKKGGAGWPSTQDKIRPTVTERVQCLVGE